MQKETLIIRKEEDVQPCLAWMKVDMGLLMCYTIGKKWGIIPAVLRGSDMIYTRFGSEVIVVGGDIDKGEVDIRLADGKVKQTYINELRADDGFNEICEAIKEVV